ncbi:tryptophan 2,3-dioxygenase family protein [Vitiosangium sp. GDMCC 1.1324]|uniref:tryptophan 2,3-dioxygenase family protein n=1 Tax=Vitiosangium sp. (strain GDMCC 1.1324) TaxID=2138576 RepID=UPI000D3BCCB0|nr:tryptophan 2,3-dioxygenase family protein [Vitiosangium sp. GDMCC 1.1324]PTL80033.1 tryptophan 2,3-dioxygenase [Vitiosangium sp. GDMCC 1.1324]
MVPLHECSPAEALRRQLQGPWLNPLLKQWVGRGELDYEKYVRTPELLALQTPPDERVTPDELLFQVVHQAQELWLKVLAHESVEAVAELDRNALWEASARLERMLRVVRGMTVELGVLETLTPDTYQVIRRNLGNGSGQESPGYNAVRMTADGLEGALERLLRRRGVELASVYLGPAAADLKRLCEQLVDYDEAFQNWLYAHFQLVRRTIGVDATVKALDGLPTRVLSGRMTKPLFPALWQVRVEMTADWRREGGYAPGAPRGDAGAGAP